MIPTTIPLLLPGGNISIELDSVSIDFTDTFWNGLFVKIDAFFLTI